MKKLISIGMLLASSLAIAGQQVQVTGSGYNLEEARIDAIEKALMKVCKSAVVSDKVFRNRGFDNSKVVIYNGCLVKNYTVLSEDRDQQLYRVAISAEVIQNHFPDRILKNHNDWFFYDMNQHKDRSTQIKFRLDNAKALVSEIFNDFPHNAFNLDNIQSNTYFRGYQGYLTISFNVSWNSNFINSINDTFDVLKDTNSNDWRPSPENVKIKRPFGSNMYGFNNFIIPSHAHQIVSANQPFVRVRIRDSYGVERVNVCRKLTHTEYLYELTKIHYLTFNSVATIKDSINIPLPSNIPDNADYKIDIVNRAFCKEQIY